MVLENFVNDLVNVDNLQFYITCSLNIEENTYNGYYDNDTDGSRSITFDESDEVVQYPAMSGKLITNIIELTSNI